MDAASLFLSVLQGGVGHLKLLPGSLTVSSMIAEGGMCCLMRNVIFIRKAVGFLSVFWDRA
jgi:hypothetical protein